ncbi:MAG: pentapeptide repeat-containing protein [Actinobacteria bacterium]|nr:pentapeptide repeat-containing protein [Actinomycetota bacterium]
MRIASATSILVAAAGLAVPAVSLAANSTTIGTGAKTCVLKPGADCHGVVHRWSVEHHGNLRKVNLRRADLRGADFRGADLRGADLRGAILRHADLREAKLHGARMSWLPRRTRTANQAVAPDGIAVTNPACAGADLTGDYSYGIDLGGGLLATAWLVGVNLSGANLSGANLGVAQFYMANLFCANLTGAYAYRASFIQANASRVNFTNADLTGAEFSNGLPGTLWTTTGAIWSNTTCPDGTVTSTGC